MTIYQVDNRFFLAVIRVDREQALNNKNDNNKRGECTMRKKDDLVKMGLTKTSVVKAIEEVVIGNNAERNRKILYRRLIDGIKYEQLAEEADLSVPQTRNIVKEYKQNVFSTAKISEIHLKKIS
jgi:hypothetical protein